MTHRKSALFFALALLTPLTASAVPTQVNHAGYLTDGTGTPTDGMRTITFGIYENKKFGTPFWTETHEVDVGHGYYAVVLGEIEPLDGDLFLGDTLYLEVDTGGFRPGTRAPMVSTPYAFRADEATSLSGGPVDATEIWVDGSPVIDIDGNWVGGTMMVDWTDLTGVPADFADGIDDVLTEAEVDIYADNNGYAYDADLFSGDWADLTGIPSDVMDGDGDLLADMSCLDGDIIVWDGLALTWTCDLDADSVLTEAEVVAMVTANGFALTADLATVAMSGDWADLTSVPADADTTLTEAEVDAYADNNGYAYDADLFSGDWNDLVNVPADLVLSESEVDAYVGDNGYAISSDLATVATSGDYNDLINTPDLSETLAGLSCGVGEYPLWDGLSWVCGVPSSSLPSDGLSQVSNGLLTNVFDEIFASTNVPLSIPDNNPGGVLDEIAIEDIGTIREIAVSVDISSSDISQLTVVLYDPENVAHTLHDKSDSGAALATTYPTDTSLVSGDLDEWIGKSPYGTWRLIVSDWSDSGISFDGELIGWSINIEVLSDIKIGINGYMDGLAPIIGVNFAGADLGGMDFQKQALPYANFEGANLRSANFEDSRLNHANFSNSDVEGVYWYNVICPSGYRVSSVSGTCCDHWTDETTGVIGCDEED